MFLTAAAASVAGVFILVRRWFPNKKGRGRIPGLVRVNGWAAQEQPMEFPQLWQR